MVVGIFKSQEQIEWLIGNHIHVPSSM